MVHQLENQWPVGHTSLQCTRRLMGLKSISPECKVYTLSFKYFLYMYVCRIVGSSSEYKIDGKVHNLLLCVMCSFIMLFYK